MLCVFMMGSTLDSEECLSCLPGVQGTVNVGPVGLRRGDGEDVVLELGGGQSHL